MKKPIIITLLYFFLTSLTSFSQGEWIEEVIDPETGLRTGKIELSRAAPKNVQKSRFPIEIRSKSPQFPPMVPFSRENNLIEKLNNIKLVDSYYINEIKGYSILRLNE